MNYEISVNNDAMSGASLYVRMPESEIDFCALNTIGSNCPDFILPFSYKNIDGEVEIAYKVGAFSKLVYFLGSFSTEEYIRLWTSLLEPLVECYDWFMNPNSFVMNLDNLYYDKHKKKVKYLYIPSINEYSSHKTLTGMVAELSRKITVADAYLENKVLRAIMVGSSPDDIIAEIKNYSIKNHATVKTASDNTSADNTSSPALEAEDADHKDIAVTASQPNSTVVDSSQNDFNATYDTGYIDNMQVNEDEPTGFRMFSGRNKKKSKKHHSDEHENTVVDNNLPVGKLSKSRSAKKAKSAVITQSTPVVGNSVYLKYVGNADLPEAIQVDINPGDIFTIGRFDSAIGKKQSNFEFDKRTKAISRRHAVIERDGGNIYKISDLSSSAGTFLDTQKLPPNTPHELVAGMRISFGNLGADYVWEVR